MLRNMATSKSPKIYVLYPAETKVPSRDLHAPSQ